MLRPTVLCRLLRNYKGRDSHLAWSVLVLRRAQYTTVFHLVGHWPQKGAGRRSCALRGLLLSNVSTRCIRLRHRCGFCTSPRLPAAPRPRLQGSTREGFSRVSYTRGRETATARPPAGWCCVHDGAGKCAVSHADQSATLGGAVLKRGDPLAVQLRQYRTITSKNYLGDEDADLSDEKAGSAPRNSHRTFSRARR